MAVHNPASSPIFGIGETAILVRDLARDWLGDARKWERRRVHRNEVILAVGSGAAVVAAIASVWALFR
jgi:hypothetical protein